ncbi:hypothetical protein K502DRAFT_325571 [Neoconidiobolus thromboides FSU 785]|nr:hypothetical protein K502DRAFT_325571 [Neoconidiobolus thromboides FSU 785]
MNFKFEHYDPEKPNTKKKSKAKPKLMKSQHVLERIMELEELIKNSVCFDAKLKKEDNQQLVYKSDISSYLNWSLAQLRIIDNSPCNFQFSANQQSFIFNFDNHLKNIIRFNEYRNNKLCYELLLSSTHFQSSFIEKGILFYAKELDPFGIWFNFEQLVKIFQSNKLYHLKMALILTFLKYKNSSLNERESNNLTLTFHTKIKLWLHESYKQPSLESLLTLVLLSFYELKLSNLTPFKTHLFSGMRMAQLLNYDKIDLSNRQVANVKNNKKISKLKRKKEIWESLVLTLYVLSISLDEPMKAFFPYNPKLSSIYKEYNHSHYMVLLEPADRHYNIPILKESRAAFNQLIKLLPKILWFIYDTKSKGHKIDKEDLSILLKQIPRKENLTLDQISRELIYRFQPDAPLTEIYTKIEKLLITINYHYTIENWLTYAPVSAILFYTTMIAYPEYIDANPVSIISFIQVSPISEVWFKEKFLKWSNTT